MRINKSEQIFETIRAPAISRFFSLPTILQKRPFSVNSTCENVHLCCNKIPPHRQTWKCTVVFLALRIWNTPPNIATTSMPSLFHNHFNELKSRLSSVSGLQLSCRSSSLSLLPDMSAVSSCFFLAVAISAACFFRHFVRRFWNHTWK